ncbi:hypothetical protein HZF05_07500 [Sphingomonas sp. CGMCC 1.13654]|uniref:Uncharacterized protein n=1 Tax=Sphingomonas chungangi TaxID=2683589 RepID=A0A838L374_9SPHN|nr:hypothetical protein [Sphingomonas chungangi]MBA2933943.1 hypothetical protein [Sphingomonas chungangi]MVW57070.1 hypothetical protein [Sphingomonas chungangi]
MKTMSGNGVIRLEIFGDAAMDFMRTPNGKAFAATRDRRIYIVWIALVWAGMLAGFVPDLARFETETHPRSCATCMQCSISPG